MHLLSRLVLTFAAAGLFVSAPSPAAHAETYNLDIDRPHRVGMRYAIEGDAHSIENSKQYADGELFADESKTASISLQAQAEVMEVDAEGHVTRMALTLRGCDILVNGRAVHIDPDRRLLIISGDETVAYEYERGGPVGADAALALELLFGDLTNKGEDEEDPIQAAMGLDQRRAPGERWDMDRDTLIQHFADSGMSAADEDISGEARFIALGAADFGWGLMGEDLAVLEMEIGIGTFAFTGEFFPEFMKLEESEMELRAELGMSLNPDSHQGWMTFSNEMSFRAVGIVPEENVELTVEMHMEDYKALRRRSVN